ncbi:MAG: transposase [Pseudomonadota bacterium]|nr:transposase [Pseudomonadota bacterium]
MTSKSVACLVSDRDVPKTHSWPHVSDEQRLLGKALKTIEYRREFPERFGSIEDARSSCWAFFFWYNEGYLHTGIGLLTSKSCATVGHTDAGIQCRQAAVSGAYARHTDRLMHRATRDHRKSPKPCGSTCRQPSIRSTKFFRKMSQSR